MRGASQPRAARPPAIAVLIAWGVAALVATAVAAEAVTATASADARRELAEDPADVLPLRLTPEMSRFLRDNLRLQQPQAVLLSSLLDLVFSPRGLGITYGNERTLTAAETFASGSGNCLSFTLMFVAMARHLGFRTYFVEVDEVTSWDQRGAAIVNNKHMYAEVELHNGLYQVDFLPGLDKRYLSRRRIDERRAEAHYFNNVGAELIADGRAAEALAWIERSLALDAAFSAAWTNLGVAQRRLGRPADAEASLRRAISLDAGADPARANLAALYLATGRAAAAAPLLAEVERHHQQNPFHHFRQGLDALRRGEPRAAADHLRAAIRRQPDEAAFHFHLALALRRAGDGAAAASFARALALASDAAERERWRERWREPDAAESDGRPPQR